MDYYESIKDAVKGRLQDQCCEVKLVEVKKKDGLCKGLVITAPDSNLVSPICYIEQGNDIQSEADRIIDLYNDAKKCCISENIIDNIFDYEKVRKMLYPEFYPIKTSKEYLKGRVVFSYGKSLNIVVKIMIEGKHMATPVEDQMLKIWGVSKETVLIDAIGNLEKEEIEFEANNGFFIRVITNRQNLCGASEMMSIRKKGIIIPASIHEVMFMEADVSAPDFLDVLKNTLTTIRIVNENELPPDEVLSDNVYFCDGSDLYEYDGKEVCKLPNYANI